jgi:hypothetical protein
MVYSFSDHGSKNKVTYFGSRYSRPDHDSSENDRRIRGSSTSEDDQHVGKLSIISQEVQRSGILNVIAVNAISNLLRDHISKALFKKITDINSDCEHYKKMIGFKVIPSQ